MTVATSTSKSGPYAGAGTVGPFTVGFRFLANDHLLVVQADADGVETVLVLDTDYTVTGAGAGSGAVTLAASLPVGQSLTITRDVPFTQEADYVNNDSFPAESHEQALDLLTMQTQQLSERVDRAAKLPVSSTADADSLTADIVLLADNLAPINTVASNIGDVQDVAAIAADIAVAADNVADITNFADVYLGPSAADPTLRADGNALQIGDLYFNTSTSLIRVYASTGWVDSQTPTPVTITRQQFSGTGAQTAFTLSSAPAFLNALFVEISGVSQVPGVDYTLSGTTLTFTSAPPVGVNNILARWFSPITAGVPNDGSVTLVKLAGGFILPTTQGGSGANYADVAALFAGIKQAATTSTSGVSALATAAEVAAGTEPAKAITPAALRGGPIQSMVRLNTQNGYGSTNTVIRRFTTVVTNVGSDITYADSATLGGSFTINNAGVYAISYTDNFGGTANMGVSLNSTQLTTDIISITAADRITETTTAAANQRACCGLSIYLAAGSVIRAHTNGGVAGSLPAVTQFTITRVA